jgi:hypothetical protein
MTERPEHRPCAALADQACADFYATLDELEYTKAQLARFRRDGTQHARRLWAASAILNRLGSCPGSHQISSRKSPAVRPIGTGVPLAVIIAIRQTAARIGTRESPLRMNST